MDRRDFFQGQYVTDAELDGAFDGAERADRAIAADLGFFGIAFGLGVAQQLAPNLTVQVTGPGSAYDQTGQRCYVPSTQNADLSVDSSAVTTAVTNPGNSKIISLFLRFKRAPGDPRMDTEVPPVQVQFLQNESFEFVVVQGVEAGSPSPPALLGNGVLLADVTRAFAQSTIVNGNISTARAQAQYGISGTPHSITATTAKAAISQLLGWFNSHVNAGAADRHHAADIDYLGGPAFADASSFPAATLEAALDTLVGRLANSGTSTDGATAIGVNAVPATLGGQPGLLGGTLLQVLQALRLASSLTYTVGPSWLDGTTNPQTTIQAMLSKIVADISDQIGSTADGSSRVGADARGSGSTLAQGSVGSQLTALADGWGKLARANVWTATQTFQGAAPIVTGITTTRLVDVWKIASIANPATGFTATTRASVSLAANGAVHAGEPAMITRENANAADFFYYGFEALDLPDGATILSASISTQGATGAANPANIPVYTLIKWDGSSAISLLSAATNDAHTFGGSPNWLTADITTTVTATGTPVVDRSSASYGLKVQNPGDGGVGSSMWVTKLSVTFQPGKLAA